jgi:hypothetical protein
MKNLILFSIFFLIYSIAGITYSQNQVDSSEIKSTVPELVKFHDVIYLIWHEAYPAKDIKALKGFVTDIKTDMAKINEAKLPGILRDKEEKWKNGLSELNKTADNYYKAADGDNEQAMLDAAEKLHSNFEMMIRIIKPMLKEIDEYHQTLYVIYHKLLPEKKYTDIAGVMDELIIKADAITKVPSDKLSKRLGDKMPKYQEAAKELYDATVALKEALKESDPKKNDVAIESMHSKYQALEKVFD